MNSGTKKLIRISIAKTRNWDVEVYGSRPQKSLAAMGFGTDHQCRYGFLQLALRSDVVVEPTVLYCRDSSPK